MVEVDRKLLAEALDKLMMVVPRQSKRHELEFIYFMPDRIVGTNAFVVMQVFFETGLDCLVSFQQMLSVSKNFTSDTLTFEVKGTALLVSGGPSTAKMSMLDLDSYIPVIEDFDWKPMEASFLFDCIFPASEFSSKDSYRTDLHGIYVDGVDLFASNVRAMAWVQMDEPVHHESFGFPAHLLKSLRQMEAPSHFFIDDRYIAFKYQSLILYGLKRPILIPLDVKGYLDHSDIELEPVPDKAKEAIQRLIAFGRLKKDNAIITIAKEGDRMRLIYRDGASVLTEDAPLFLLTEETPVLEINPFFLLQASKMNCEVGLLFHEEANFVLAAAGRLRFAFVVLAPRS